MIICLSRFLWTEHIFDFFPDIRRHTLIFATVQNDCSGSKIAEWHILNPIQDGLFQGCSQIGEGGAFWPPSLKSATHILQWWNLAQLYLTKGRSKKCINHVTHSLSSADISIFSPEISKFCYIKKHTYKLDFDT